MHRPHLHVGLRTIKTALAVTIALMLTELYGANGPIFAGIGAILAITHTFRDSLREALTQFAGILVGGVIGVVLVLTFPHTPPWAIGLGIVACIVICNLLKITFVSTTACIIVLSACVGSDGNLLQSMLFRLLNTSVGMSVGILVNMTIRPYNNRPKIMQLLWEITDSIPGHLDACVFHGRYSDLASYEMLLHRLNKELAIFSRQRPFRKADLAREAAFLSGCVQLATRMYQELGAIGCMDSFGIPSDGNLERLGKLDLEVPADFARNCSLQDSIVTNYHLEKLLDAREALLSLLQETP